MGQPFNESAFINTEVYFFIIPKKPIFSIGNIMAYVILQGKNAIFFVFLLLKYSFS